MANALSNPQVYVDQQGRFVPAPAYHASHNAATHVLAPAPARQPGHTTLGQSAAEISARIPRQARTSSKLPLVLGGVVGVGSIVAGLATSVLGGTRVQISGPTGAFIAVLAGVTAQYGIAGLQAATLMAGLMLLAMGLLQLGSVIRFIPNPVSAL